MTDRISAALEAADKATPGPWAVRSDDCHFGTMTEVFGNDGIIAETNTEDDAILIAAAPDMAAEIVKLRKWQSEALPYIEEKYNIDLDQIVALEMEVPEWETNYTINIDTWEPGKQDTPHVEQVKKAFDGFQDDIPF